jgi:ataxia telangiectasia mutated family protein
MAECSVHLISRKPFLTLFRHLTALLVHSGTIFPPAALDYSKALRSLLSYPPHLESLDEDLWRKLMGICWAVCLGDEIVLDSEWQDEMDGPAVGEPLGSGMEVDDTTSHDARRRSTITQSTSELLSLIPILLSSSKAPILPPFPTASSPLPPPTSIGMSTLLKIYRFFRYHPSETSGHLPIVRALNLVFAEMELNSHTEFVTAGVKLITPLVALWATRNTALREQVLIALRTVLPFITHESVSEDTEEIVAVALGKLVESLPREALFRWGFEPLDLHILRLRDDPNGRDEPFSLSGVSVSVDQHRNLPDPPGWIWLLP